MPQGRDNGHREALSRESVSLNVADVELQELQDLEAPR